MVEVVINQNDGFVSITAVGGETDLDFDFPIYEKSHLRIIRTRSGVEETLVLDTDYTIATDQLGVTAGGTAVLAGASTPAVAADVYTLLLDPPEARTTDFSQAGDFFAATLNREMDLQTQMIQELRRDVDKSARLPDTSTLTSLTLPTPTADAVLGWNATADALVNYTPNDNAYLNVSSFMETVLDDANASTALSTLGFSTFFKTLIDETTDDAVVNLLIGGFDEIVGTTGFKRETADDDLLNWEYWYNGTGNVQTDCTRFISQPRASDVAAKEMRQYADHAYPKASTHTSGGAHRLAGGIGKKFFTVTDYSLMSGNVLHFRVNSTVSSLTEGVDFNAETSNDVTAGNIATAINSANVIGNTGAAGTYSPYSVDAEANGAVVNLFPHPHQHQFDIAVTGSGITATQNTDGEVSLGNNGFVATYRGGLSSNSAWPVHSFVAERFGAAAGDGFGPRLDMYIRTINGSFGSVSTIGTLECLRAGADNTGTWRITPRNAGSGSVYYEFDTAAFHPAGNGVQDLGTSGQKWNDIYASNGTIQTSDETLKDELAPLSDKEKAAFAKLKIVSYRLKSNPEKKHIGVSAQQVIEAFKSEGLDAFDYYVVHKGEDGLLSVSYSELMLGMMAA